MLENIGVRRRNADTKRLVLKAQECEDQVSKTCGRANRFKLIDSLDYVVDMLKKKDIVEIAQCDFYRSALVREWSLELVRALTEKV